MSTLTTADKPDRNYALDDFNADTTPEGFEVLGPNQRIDLTKPFAPPASGGCKAEYTDDAPGQTETRSTRSVKFTKADRDGQVNFCWFGQHVTVCEGDHLTFSVWIKFVGSVPPKSANFGLKHHGDPDGSSEGDSPIFNDFVQGAKADTWMHVSKTWVADYSFNDNLILIFDTVPKGQVIHFTDMSVYKVSTQPSLYFNGETDFIEFPVEDAVLPEGNSDYTVEAWVRPMSLPKAGAMAGVVGWGDFDQKFKANSLKLDGTGRIVNSWASSDLASHPLVNITRGFHHIAMT